MKSFYLICCLCIILCLPFEVKAQSSSFPRPVDAERLTDDFQKGSLNSLHLEAFEARAKQKFQDFLDYCTYYFEEEIEENLQTHLRQQILNLFYSDSLDCMGSKGIMVFLDQEEYEIPAASEWEVVLLKAFENRGNYYEGMLRASFKGKTTQLINLQIEIRLAKSLQSFGSESMDLWKVFLGAIVREN